MKACFACIWLSVDRNRRESCLEKGGGGDTDAKELFSLFLSPQKLLPDGNLVQLYFTQEILFSLKASFAFFPVDQRKILGNFRNRAQKIVAMAFGFVLLPRIPGWLRHVSCGALVAKVRNRSIVFFSVCTSVKDNTQKQIDNTETNFFLFCNLKKGIFSLLFVTLLKVWPLSIIVCSGAIRDYIQNTPY